MGDLYAYGPPVVSSVSPNAGPLTAGTTVTITGTGFISGSTVKFGANAATGVVVNSAASITAVSPAGTTGTVNVIVTTSGGASATSVGDQFTYDAAPTVTALSPAAQTTGNAGTTVTITGTGFVNGATVKFGGQRRHQRDLHFGYVDHGRLTGRDDRDVGQCSGDDARRHECDRSGQSLRLRRRVLGHVAQPDRRFRQRVDFGHPHWEQGSLRSTVSCSSTRPPT